MWQIGGCFDGTTECVLNEENICLNCGGKGGKKGPCPMPPTIQTRKAQALKDLNALPEVKPHTGPGAPRQAVQQRGKMVATPGDIDTSKETHELKTAVMSHWVKGKGPVEGRVSQVPISKITALQSSVSIDSVKHMIEKGERNEKRDDLPVGVKLPDGRIVLHDGTHRYVADKLSGATHIKMEVYSLPKGETLEKPMPTKVR